jgi:hypothetical protein
VVDLGRELELLHQTGDHHGSGCARNSALRNIIAKKEIKIIISD